MRAYAASWVITGTPGERPLCDAAVVLDSDGRVLAVGPTAALRTTYSEATWSDESAILLPGLVNAHVHLELSKLRGETRSGGGFGPWVTSMMERRDALQPEQDEEAIDAGISELLRAGTAAIGEVSNSLASVPLLETAPLLGRVFHEVFGMGYELASRTVELAHDKRASIRDWPRNLGYALAPHTVYSLHPDVLCEITERAQSAGVRTSLHLSEHAAERAFLSDGTGPFADFLMRRGVPSAHGPAARDGRGSARCRSATPRSGRRPVGDRARAARSPPPPARRPPPPRGRRWLCGRLRAAARSGARPARRRRGGRRRGRRRRARHR